MSKENRNDPTSADSDVMDALQQVSADVDKAIAAQMADPDRKTDPDDAPVNDALQTLKKSIKAAIVAQAKDGAADARALALVREVRSGSTVSVKSEPRVYTETGPHSYFRDLANYSVGIASDQQRVEATARIKRHMQEVDYDFRNGDEYTRRQIGELRRSESDPELRAALTTTTDAAFVTPQYLISNWITYRSADRSFTNQCTLLPLPAYGTQFNVPAFTSVGAAAAQANENQGINAQVPSGSDVQVTLSTYAGYVPVSQQLLDRSGYEGQGGSFDSIVIQQSMSQLNASVDAYLIAQALAQASAVTQSTAATTTQFYLDLATARNLLADTAGIKLPGTHAFTTSDFAGWLTSQVDSEGRPIVVPDANSIASRDGDDKWSGWMGLILPGNLKWFSDDNILTATQSIPISGSSTQTCIVIGSPSDLLAWIGPMVPFTAQQTNAQDLSVICGLRQYVAAVPRHAAAFSYITGSGYLQTLV